LGHNMSSAMTSILSNVVAPVVALLSVGFVLWGIGFIWRLLKNAFSRSCDCGESDYWNGYDADADAKDRLAQDYGFKK